MKHDFCFNRLDVLDLEDMYISLIEQWIYKKCREIAHQYRLFPDMSGFNPLRSHFKNISSVSVEMAPARQIIIMFSYIDNNNKKPPHVYFVKCSETQTYSDYLASKVVFDMTKIKIK